MIEIDNYMINPANILYIREYTDDIDIDLIRGATNFKSTIVFVGNIYLYSSLTPHELVERLK